MRNFGSLLCLFLFSGESLATPSTVLAPDVLAIPECPTGKSDPMGVTVFISNDPNDGDRVNDIAGMAISKQQIYMDAPVMWVIQDEQHDPWLIAYSGGTGTRIKSIDLDPVLKTTNSNKDFEELVIGPCNTNQAGNQDSGDCLYVMDIGNNDARNDNPEGQRGRSRHYIYKVKEPSVADAMENPKTTIDAADVEVIEYSYDYNIPGEDIKTADAESAFLDPVSGMLYVLTRWDNSEQDWTRLFEINPNIVGEAQVATSIGEMDERFTSEGWTRGTISIDGKVLMFGNEEESWLWTRDAVNGETLAETMLRPPCDISLRRPPTGSSYQAMTYDTVGAGYLEISKGNDQTLFLTTLEGMIPVTAPFNPNNPNNGTDGETIVTRPPGSGFGNAGQAGLYIEPLPTGSSLIIGFAAVATVAFSVSAYESYTRKKGIVQKVGTLEQRRALSGNSWRVAQDSDGQTYYYNKNTRETSWHPPPGFEEL